MAMSKRLSALTKPELDCLKEKLNLTEDEEMVFILLSKGKSKVQISLECAVSTSTVGNRISAIKSKIDRL